MGSVEIAGIRLPKYEFPGFKAQEFKLVETDSVRKNLQNILYPILEGKPLLLVGDAGVGKNAIIYYINSLRNHPTFRFSFNEDTLPEDLIGSYRLTMDGKGFEWIHGPLTQAISNNSSFVADEMNLSSPDVLKRFSTVYENGYIDLVEGDGSRIHCKEGFNFIATQNPSEGFEGRKSLPFEITKHFTTIYMDPYSPDEVFYILGKLYPSIPKEFITAAIKITMEAEKKIQTGKLGKGDLEKYHFNLRTLKKYCNRLSTRKSLDSELAFQELSDLFTESFRKETDRKEMDDLIHSELSMKEKSEVSVPNFYVDQESLYSDDISVRLQNPEKVKQAMSRIPFPSVLRIFTEKCIRSLESTENLLIESGDESEATLVLPLLTAIYGPENMELISLCKGIHTSDVLGAMKPTPNNQILWKDGPLTRGIRNSSLIVIKGLEASGAELVEKLNMLTDDARSITLPPESGTVEPIQLSQSSRIIAFKTYRVTKTTPTISRAFRNRFTSLQFPYIEDLETLKEIAEFFIPDSNISEAMSVFHKKIKEMSQKRVIGSANIIPYSFGISNFLKWKDHIYKYKEKDPLTVILRGGKLTYTSQIADPKERQDMDRMLEAIFKGLEIPENLLEKIEEKKKTFSISSDLEKKKWWDPSLHQRDANTGKARLKNSGNPLKKGIEINTPETGGNTKEGPDAWYGSETRGNMGQGEPAGGGGAWGYRTEELYKQFLAKRKILWAYALVASLEEFKEIFGKELDEVEMNLEKLFDPHIDITRLYQHEGRRIDTRKYLALKSGRGDTKVFDKTIIDKKNEKLKGVEVVFLVSKSRRIFNFEYSIATISALITSSHILNEHEVIFSVYTYSDRNNRKDHIDLVPLKTFEDDYSPKLEEEIFNSLCEDWQGDSVYEFRLIEDMDRYFTPDAQTKITVMISDFRGQRGKMTLEEEIHSRDNTKLREEILKNEKKSYIFFGVGLGRRYIAEHLFSDSIQVTPENFSSMPNLIGTELSRLILTHHSLRN